MESVLAQTFEDLELVVCDNASEDDTESVVRSFSDKRVRYFRNPQNIGHRENWNRCLHLARGNYIVIFPDDDMMLPENLAKKVEVLLRSPQVGLVHSKYHLIDEEGRIIKYDTNWGHGPDRTADALERREDLLTACFNTVNVPTVLFRRACYERLGRFSDRVRFAYDWEYWMRIAIDYDVAFLAQPLVKWRIHSASITKTYMRNPVVQLREDLAAKREVFKHHIHGIPEGRQLEREMWRNMAKRIFHCGRTMLEDGWGEAEARAFVLKMCLAFPWMLYERSLWKILLKSVLRLPVAELLRSLSEASPI